MPTRPKVFRYERMCNFGAKEAFRPGPPRLCLTASPNRGSGESGSACLR
jgi:hypothetical protein